MKRFLGITTVKRRIGKSIGIPLTKSGRQQMVGRIVLRMLKGGK